MREPEIRRPPRREDHRKTGPQVPGQGNFADPPGKAMMANPDAPVQASRFATDPKWPSFS